MKKPTLQNLIDITKNVILPFYSVKRHNTLLVKSGLNETDAEHSWSVAIIAAALARQISPELDTGKICEFGMVHDLVEVFAGDTSNFADEDKLLSKELREKAALLKLKNELSTLPWIAETVIEYESQSSAEARFVKSIDKLMPLMYDYIEAGRFYKENKITKEYWISQMQKHREKAMANDEAYAYYNELRNLLLENSDLFYNE